MSQYGCDSRRRGDDVDGVHGVDGEAVDEQQNGWEAERARARPTHGWSEVSDHNDRRELCQPPRPSLLPLSPRSATRRRSFSSLSTWCGFVAGTEGGEGSLEKGRGSCLLDSTLLSFHPCCLVTGFHGSIVIMISSRSGSRSLRPLSTSTLI